MKHTVPLVALGLALLSAGCRSFVSGGYPESVDEGFVPVGDAIERVIREPGNKVVRYEFLTDAPFGGEGVLPARADNVGRQIWGKDKNFAGEGSYVRKPGMLNFGEAVIIGGRLEVYVNGCLVSSTDRMTGHTKWVGFQGKEQYRNVRVKRLPDDATEWTSGVSESAPAGFETYFDGDPGQLETMWKGVTTEDRFDNPFVRASASAEDRAAKQAAADRERDAHWHVRHGALYFDGFKGGYSLATKKDYGDFEMWADWRLMSVTGDSGLYLRGCPQVQIWDAHNQWHIGSGGLYNNQKNPSKALTIADRQVGDWNRFHVIMRGDKVTVWLNGELVTDGVTLENYWDRSRPVPEIEQIELQCHGDPTEWRNIFIRKL